jgi:hypothetical protein
VYNWRIKMGQILIESDGDAMHHQPEFEVACDGCGGPVRVRPRTLKDAISTRERGRIEGVYCEKCK